MLQIEQPMPDFVAGKEMERNVKKHPQILMALLLTNNIQEVLGALIKE